VNNTTAGITSTLDTVEQTLSAEDGKEDSAMDRVLYGTLLHHDRFITVLRML
jgi:hypothetical protein